MFFPGRSYREGLSQRRNQDLLQVRWRGTHSERLPLQIISEKTNQPNQLESSYLSKVYLKSENSSSWTFLEWVLILKFPILIVVNFQLWRGFQIQGLR